MTHYFLAMFYSASEDGNTHLIPDLRLFLEDFLLRGGGLADGHKQGAFLEIRSIHVHLANFLLSVIQYRVLINVNICSRSWPRGRWYLQLHAFDLSINLAR